MAKQKAATAKKAAAAARKAPPQVAGSALHTLPLNPATAEEAVAALQFIQDVRASRRWPGAGEAGGRRGGPGLPLFTAQRACAPTLTAPPPPSRPLLPRAPPPHPRCRQCSW